MLYNDILQDGNQPEGTQGILGSTAGSAGSGGTSEYASGTAPPVQYHLGTV